ncbi:MAG TPA: hypothetical protein VFI92_07330 [Steroidobacteraceae bacterium]|nr:hypothetical protein [Steroidobacteraceae bacterium]
MNMRLTMLPWLLLCAHAAAAQDAPQGEPVAKATEAAAAKASKTDGGAKVISGMSILGNQEAPKALVIVPWKSSEIGDASGLDTLLDDSRQPVDKDVFLRELSYYEIRSK